MPASVMFNRGAVRSIVKTVPKTMGRQAKVMGLELTRDPMVRPQAKIPDGHGFSLGGWVTDRAWP